MIENACCIAPSEDAACSIEDAIVDFLCLCPEVAEFTDLQLYACLPECPTVPYAVLRLLNPGEGTKRCGCYFYTGELRIRIYARTKAYGINVAKAILTCLVGQQLESCVGRFAITKPSLPSFDQLEQDLYVVQLLLPIKISQTL